MNSRPLLTICIPTYNRCGYLQECLQSILDQTFQDYKILILDNASTQDVAGLAYGFHDSRIGYMRNTVNIGAIGNIRKGLAQRSSPYLMVFHDDDCMHPDLLKYQIELMESDEDLLFVGACAAFVDSSPIFVPPIVHHKGEIEICQNAAKFVRLLLQGVPLHLGSVIYRSSSLEHAEFDETRFAMISDRPFLVDIAKHGACAVMTDPLINYRRHPDQVSRVGLLSEDNIIALVAYYRDVLAANRWTWSDKKLFYTHATNHLLDSYLRLPKSDKSPFPRFVIKCVKNGVMNPFFLNFMGGRALLKLATKVP